ncbi:hypothetical protein [Aeromonas veronii]|uniref:hypothetical protein n=1 Tax=Aeromonas veronii TaxID=654 RepID=UPI002446764E|nr:hypothetical protein [Aeromonas veronii]
MLDQTENKVKEWYAFLNDAAGLFGFSLFISAITSPAPESVASISITFLSFWLLLKAQGVHKYLRREERLKGFFCFKSWGHWWFDYFFLLVLHFYS